MRYKMGDLVELVTEKNSDLKYGLDDIIGVTLEKQMIPTIANLTQTNLDDFIIVHPKDFVYNPRTHGKKIGLGFNTSNRCYIATWNNNTFRVKPQMMDTVLPEYLYLHFLRDRWDKEACFHAWGSSTIVLLWSSFCDMSIDVPPFSEQRKIVRDYQVITDRIELLQKINGNLNKTGKTIYDMYSEAGDGEELKLSDILLLLKDGTHNPPERVPKGVPLLAGQNIVDGFIDYSKMTYISEEDYLSIHSRYQPMIGDLILSKIGTVGKVAILREEDIPMAIHCNSALLRFSSEKIDSSIAYWLLQSKAFVANLTERITNSVQEFVSLGSIADIPVILPSEDKREPLSKLCSSLLTTMSANNREINKLICVKEMLLSSLSYNNEVA